MKHINLVNIVCVGNWNKKIFIPDWVATNLFELEKDSSLEAMFNTSELDIGYKVNNILLLPKENAIEIRPEVLNTETINLSNKVLNNLISLLPHTPIKAIGINIKVNFAKHSELNFARKIRDFNCSLDNYKLSQVKFTEQKEKYTLNIITDMLKEKYEVNFNFHHSLENFQDGFYFDSEDIKNKIELVEGIIGYE